MRGGLTSCSAGSKNDGDDESIEGKRLCENHHQNESDQDISLGVSSNTGVTDDTNAESSGEGRETAAQASAELLVSCVVSVVPVLRLGNILRGVLELRHYEKTIGQVSLTSLIFDGPEQLVDCG